VGIIEIILDQEYFEKIKEIRSMVESELEFSLNALPTVHFSNIEIIALILGIIAIVSYIPLKAFSIIWVVIGSYVIYKSIQYNSGSDGLRLQLGLRKIRVKKKIKLNSDFIIDIPKRYRRFSDIDLLIQKIRLIKFNENTDDEIEKTNDFLWASAFSKNAFNYQIGYWIGYFTIFLLYIFSVFQNYLQFNPIFFILLIIQIIAFWYVTALEGNLRFFIFNNFKRGFLLCHVIWISSIIGIYILLIITYLPVFFQLISLQNILLVGTIGIFEYFFIMLCNDFFAAFIISGMTNDKIQELRRLKKTLDYQIYQKDRLIENPDTYFYDYLLSKRYKLTKWRSLVFAKYVLEPDLTYDDIRLISNSSLHYEILQGEVGMKGMVIKNKEILKRYGYDTE